MPSEFQDYFNDKISQELERNARLGIATKYDEVQQAATEKIEATARLRTEQLKIRALQEKSWVGRLGLDPDGIAGETVNKVASGVSGASTLLGNLVSLPTSISAAADEAQLSQSEIEAYNRKQQGIATPEDLQLLNRRKGFYTESPQELIDRSNKARGISNAITKATDISGIVHSKQRDKLTDAMGMDFQAAWDQTGLANLFEKDKQVGGAKDVAEGLAKLVYNAGEAAVTNPSGASEYVVENLPQLLSGGLLKHGTKLLTAANAGYALDNYNKGMEKYAAENNGAYPPAEERQKMALFAASTAVAEQLGELGQLKAIGKVKKAVDGAEDGTKTGFLKSVGNVGKAGAAGYGEEAVTEGYQTYAEGQAQLKPVTAKEVYIGAGIGGLAGGGTALGGRAAAEVLGATPEKQQERVETIKRSEAYQEAVKTGNVDSLLDPKSMNYNPASAVNALQNHSLLETTSEETKQANLVKANQIIADLEAKRTDVSEKYARVTDAGVQQLRAEREQAIADGDDVLAQMYEDQINDILKDTKAEPRLKKQLATIDAQLAESKSAAASFQQELQSQLVDVDQALSKIKGADRVAAQEAASRVINLSMAVPERLSVDVASSLAADTTNGLTDQQRAYFRAFSESRIAEHEAKKLDDVNQDILFGGKNYVGIQQYREDINSALAANDPVAAVKQLAQLSKFAADHKAKAATAAKALKQSDETRKPVQIRSDGQQGWFIHEGPLLTNEERAAEGAFTVHRGSMNAIAAFAMESRAIDAALKELSAAVDVKVLPPSEVENVKDVPPAKAPEAAQDQPAAEAKTEASSTEGTGTDGQGSTERDVPSNNDRAAGEESQTIGVAEEAPASSSKTVETKEGVQDQSTEETSTELKPATVAAFQDPSPEGTPFNQRNLIADYFTQSAGSDDADSQRPLAKVRDFLTQTAEPLTNFLKDKTLSVKQQAAIDLLRDKALQWNKTIVSNLTRDKREYWYTDMMQFLIREADGKLNLDQNVKAAMTYAAFDLVMDQGTRTPFNTDEEINAILGRDDDHPVTQDERNVLGLVGTRQNVVVSSLARTAIQALGIKSKQDAPVDLMPELENALGAHILKMLLDQGILVRESVKGSVMARLMESNDTNENADFSFIKLARTDGALNEQANEIVDALLNTKNVLDKLMGVEPSLKEPSLEPIPFTQKTTKNTNQRVPEKLAKIIEHENSVPNIVRQDMWQIATLIGRDVLYKLAGVKEVDLAKVHAVNRKSQEAKNDGLKREVDRFMAFVENMADLTAPMYFDHVVWKQQRVGIATNVINPQTSKVHRFMLYRPSWDTEVNLNDDKQMDNFRLRVLEGLGVKTDKQSNEKSLASYSATVGAQVIQDAVEALRSTLYEGGITDNGQDKIVAAVELGGEKMHSLDALVALAHESQALKQGNPSFKVQMMGEIDGVTNGPMLSNLMLGAADTAEKLFELLKRGGFFAKDSPDTNYNVWRGKLGNQDLYEITAAHMIQAVQGMLAADPKLGVGLSAVWAFTGNLVEETKESLKARRNLVKTPLTAMIFGSSTASAVDSMADDFVESIYQAIESAAGKGNVETVLRDINTLLILGKGPSLKAMTTEELMNHEFDVAQVKALKKVFKETLGKAVETTMAADFGGLMSRRTTLNGAAQLAFEIYNAAYTSLRDVFIKELVDKGEIAVDSKGNPIHDLTGKQTRELRKRVVKLMPTLQTLMGKQSESLAAGLFGAKTKRKLSTRKSFQSQIKFGTPFKDNGAKSVRVNAMESTEQDPGVAMVIMGVHSTDSAISHTAADGNEVLNVHDAHGSGLANFEQTAQNLNKATFQAMLDYSLPSEMYQMLARTVRGLSDLLNDETVPPQVAKAIVAALEKTATKQKLHVTNVLSETLHLARMTAYHADKVRLDTLAQLGVVDQYALEGGQYEVTEQDSAAAEAKRTQLVSQASPKDQAALDNVRQKLFDATLELIDGRTSESDRSDMARLPELQTELATQEALELGKPLTPSDPQIVQMLQANPQTTAKAVMAALLQTGKLSPIQQKILSLLNKVVDPDLKFEMLTAESDLSKVDKPTENSRGWYVKGTELNRNGAIYVLGPDFVYSGLTAEVLLHELVHAALVTVVQVESKLAEQNGGKYTTDAGKALQELIALQEKAKEYVKANNLQGFDAALGNIDEFIAYGMTNRDFQTQVLTKIQMPSNTRSNALVNGMKKFIESLARMLYKRPNENLENGLYLLVQNVSALAYQAKLDDEQRGQRAASATSPVNLSMAAVNATQALGTQEIFRALENGAVSPQFQSHLAQVLTTIEERLHGPFGSFLAQFRDAEAKNPLAAWLKTMETGKAPFASAIVASGMAGSAQEDFVMQQVEATVKAMLNGTEASTTAVYRSLSKLYTEVSAKLKPQDFINAGLTADDYDFVFKLEADNGEKSDYLARFMALGLGHEKFNELLKFKTAQDDTAFGAGDTLFDRMINIFDKIVEFFNQKITKTFGGQPADEKLQALLDDLVTIEAKKRHSLARKAAGEIGFVATIEQKTKGAVDTVKAKVGEVADSKFIKENRLQMVQAVGTAVRTFTGGRVDQVMDALRKVRDSKLNERDGLLAGLAREVRGPAERFKMLLIAAKRNEGDRKDIISQHARMTMKAFKDAGKHLDSTAKAAISSVLLRTGAHNLMGHYSMAQIEHLIHDSAALDAAIDSFKARLTSNLRVQHIEQANHLGMYKATGRNTAEVLMMNAHVIARMFGTQYAGQITEQQAAAEQKAIAVLATLYGIKYSHPAERAAVSEVMRTENLRTDGNGVQFTLELTKELERDSLERLFNGNPTLAVHGYTPEITNPHTEIRVADRREGLGLLKQGYVKGAKVSVDPTDPNQTERHIYVLRDGGLAPWLSGFISLTSLQAKGSEKHSGYLNVRTEVGLENAQTNASIMVKKVAAMKQPRDPGRDLSKQLGGSKLAPVYNEQGKIRNWRYLMLESTKNTILERTNDFDQIVGALAGSIFDKVTSKEQNELAIRGLREQYELDRKTNPEAYIEVGERTADRDMRELWDMLPQHTKDAVADIWGRNGMRVRKDSLDIAFGYRKLSVADFLRREQKSLDGVQKIAREFFNVVARSRGMDKDQADAWAKRLGLAIVKGERGWQEIVHEIKDMVVVKNLTTLLGNIYSNDSLLFVMGVEDRWHHQWVAIKGVMSYQADSERLAEVETMLATGYQYADMAELRREAVRLRDAIARNPIKPLIDAGMMPTIVEDVEAEVDPYSYKTLLARKVEGYTSRVPEGIKAVGRVAYMTRDTKLYKFLSKTTQYSDFVARYALYQHLTTKAENPLSHADALSETSDAFVNYDVPMHRMLQYTDDMGFTPFIKYFFRIQRFLLKTARENPARVMSLALLGRYWDLGPIVLDSSFVAHIGNNPFSLGALRYFDTLDELLTAKAAMSLVK